MLMMHSYMSLLNQMAWIRLLHCISAKSETGYLTDKTDKSSPICLKQLQQTYTPPSVPLGDCQKIFEPYVT